MRILGIIDIGSNSMRLVIVQIRTDGSFKVINELRENVRLGEKTNDIDALSPAKMLTAIETLRFFHNLCDALGVTEIICVATEAVRRASNQSEFIKIAEEQLGLKIRVISGVEEAYYDYFGVVNTINIPNGLIMDIGGGSTELLLIKENKIKNVTSLPFGAITLSQMFHLENIISDQNKKSLQRFLQESFNQIDWIRGDWPLIGIGGSFRNIGKIDRKLKNYPLNIAHNYPLASNSFRYIYEMLNGLSLEERTEIKGLSKDRADIFPGALEEIAVLLETTGITDIFISGAGLREGLIYEQLLENKQPVYDVLDFSLQNIMNNFELNQMHARHVWEISRQLFVQLQQGFGVDNGKYNVLKTAALLHDCGINISYYDHHKHSFYEILNSRLNGLTHSELIMAAWVASLHRKDEDKMTVPYRPILSSDEIRNVQKLGVMLRIAENLDLRQNGNIYEIRCTDDKNCVRIKVSAKVNPSLEIRNALSIGASFEKYFKRKLSIEEA